MGKLFGVTAACALLLNLGPVAFAADVDQRDEPQTQPTQTEPPAQREVNDPAAGGAVASEQYLEYLSSLKNCEPLNGQEREDCIQEMRRKHGQM